jgi:hypothetical protein
VRHLTKRRLEGVEDCLTGRPKARPRRRLEGVREEDEDMRRFVLIAVSMGLGVYAWTVAEPERAARAQAEADAEAAIALRCDAEGDLGDAECQKVLTEKFASGHATPQAILRTHCTKWSGPFVVVKEKPPKLCVDRFGGWLSG